MAHLVSAFRLNLTFFTSHKKFKALFWNNISSWSSRHLSFSLFHGEFRFLPTQLSYPTDAESLYKRLLWALHLQFRPNTPHFKHRGLSQQSRHFIHKTWTSRRAAINLAFNNANKNTAEWLACLEACCKSSEFNNIAQRVNLQKRISAIVEGQHMPMIRLVCNFIFNDQLYFSISQLWRHLLLSKLTEL